MQRRNFVKTLAVTAAGISVAPKLFATPSLKRPMGVQLYTIRDAISKDLLGSLQRLSKLGYNEVELAGYDGSTFYGKSPKEFGKICNDLGLTIISSHYQTGRVGHGAGTLTNGWQKAVDDAAEINIKYMVCAWLHPEERSMEDYKNLIGILDSSGSTCKKSKIQLAYHNHNFEFPPVDGVIPYDYMLQQLNPELVKMEVDLYWITKAGKDPVAYFNKYPGRFQLWHLKDMDKTTGSFAEVGNGVIDFDRIFAARKTAGLKYWFVEQDECKGDPFDSLAMSRDYILRKKY